MRQIKVVQIGIGHDHAALVLDIMLSRPDIFDVVGLALPPSEETEYAEKLQKYRDDGKITFLSVDDALSYPELDGVIIETEEVNLTKYATMAAERGLNVHMDKPGGFEHKDFEYLVKVLKEKNLVFTTGYMYRFNPAVQDALKKIKEGKLGEIYAVEAQMGGEHTTAKRQWLERFPGGMTFFLGCHLIDLIYQIQGEPDEIIPLNTSTHYDGVTADDYGMVVYKYPNGVSFAKSCVNEPGGFMRRQLVICGTEGTIEINPLETCVFGDKCKRNGDQYTTVRETYRTGNWFHTGEFKNTEIYNRYESMMINFAEIICGDKENPYSYDYELNLNKLIMKSCGKEID